MTRTAVSLVMTRDVVTVELDTPYKRIVVLLSDHRIGAVPVLEGGAVVGVVSETDLLAKPERYDQPDPPAGGHLGRARQLRRKADALRAEELMTGPAVTVLPATSVGEAARVMHRHHVKHLPVVDDAGRLVGIVARRDLLRVFLDDDADVQARIVREVFERVLWADTSTVQVSVTDGVVILRGRLHRRSEVTLAARLAAAQDGVVAVDNELTYDTDDTVHDTLVTPGW